MSSASATLEIQKEHQVRCPSSKCRRLLLKGGKVKCRSDHETSLAELQAIRLLRGETTHREFLNELDSQIPYDELPPAHEPIQDIMGDNFIALHEIMGFDKAVSRLSLEKYLSMIRVPFSLETLKETRDTHWLIPFIPGRDTQKNPAAFGERCTAWSCVRFVWTISRYALRMS